MELSLCNEMLTAAGSPNESSVSHSFAMEPEAVLRRHQNTLSETKQPSQYKP